MLDDEYFDDWHEEELSDCDIDEGIFDMSSCNYDHDLSCYVL